MGTLLSNGGFPIVIGLPEGIIIHILQYSQLPDATLGIDMLQWDLMNQQT